MRKRIPRRRIRVKVLGDFKIAKDKFREWDITPLSYDAFREGDFTTAYVSVFDFDKVRTWFLKDLHSTNPDAPQPGTLQAYRVLEE